MLIRKPRLRPNHSSFKFIGLYITKIRSAITDKVTNKFNYNDVYDKEFIEVSSKMLYSHCCLRFSRTNMATPNILQTVVVTQTDKPAMVLVEFLDSSLSMTPWFSVNVFIKKRESPFLSVSSSVLILSGVPLILGKLFLL